MVLADLHIHSNFSDGRLSIAEIVDLYGKRGFGAIAITDHLCERYTLLGMAAEYLDKTLTPETFTRYLEVIDQEAERAWDQYGMIVLPGVEFTKNAVSHSLSAHVLGVGIRQFIEPDQSVEEICQQIRSQGGVAIAAHPVSTRRLEHQTYYLWNKKQDLHQCFDAWEVASGPHLFNEVIEARLPIVANSDMHHPRQMTSWKTLLSGRKHPEAVLECVRKQKLDVRFFKDNLQ